MLLTLLTQAALPVALVGWLAFAPARSLAGYLVQAAGTGLALLALKLVALWMVLPWSLALVYGSLWALVIAQRTLRRGFGFETALPTTLPGWLALLGMFTLGAIGASLALQGFLGRQLPDAGVVDMPLPLGPGTYLVANGGSREIVNGHIKTLNPAVQRFRRYRGQSYGIDLIRIDTIGLRARGLRPRDPAAYAIYGEPVYAPCDGTVIASRNDRPDMQVPQMDREVIEGNHVLLDCGNFELLLAHFQAGSVRVEAGSVVAAGEQLGIVGNSGNTAEPHLHISAQLPGTAAAPLSGQPLAITFGGRFPVRNDRFQIPGQGIAN